MNPICSLANYVILCCALFVSSCSCGQSQVGPEASKPSLRWEFDLSGKATEFRRACSKAELAGLPESLIFTVLENSNPARVQAGVAVSFEIAEKNLAPETLPVHTISFFPPEQTGGFSIRMKEQIAVVLRRMENRPEASVFLVFALISFDEKNKPESLSLKCRVSEPN